MSRVLAHSQAHTGQMPVENMRGAAAWGEESKRRGSEREKEKGKLGRMGMPWSSFGCDVALCVGLAENIHLTPRKEKKGSGEEKGEAAGKRGTGERG